MKRGTLGFISCCHNSPIDPAVPNSPPIPGRPHRIRHYPLPAPPSCALPPCVRQALGTGIASELDLAYFHVRYSAASRFDAGGVAADAADLVVPPPEVYFVCLVFHMPSVADLRALPALRNPALRRMLGRVFDLPVDIEEATALQGACFMSGLRRAQHSSCRALGCRRLCAVAPMEYECDEAFLS